MNKHYTAGKLISNEELDLVEVIQSSVGLVFVPLKKKIAWVEETEATTHLFYKEAQLKTYSTYNDFYGYETSKRECIKDAKELAERIGLEEDSGLEFRVNQTIKRTPYILLEEPTEKKKMVVVEIGQRYFLNEPTLLEQYKKLASDPLAQWEDLNEIRFQLELAPKALVEGKTVWTTTKGDL